MPATVRNLNKHMMKKLTMKKHMMRKHVQRKYKAGSHGGARMLYGPAFQAVIITLMLAT